MRVSIYSIPTEPMICTVNKNCPYRAGLVDRIICIDPRIAKGNSDATCHKMANKDLLSFLNKPDTKQENE